MPVKIRLARHGRKSRPFYYIVVADSRAPRDGRFIERIGSYNPMTNPATIDLNFDKALAWLDKGAQPTDTARNILSHEGVMMKKHLLKGVKKGAFTLEECDRKYQIWRDEKNIKNQTEKDAINKDIKEDVDRRFKAETKIKEARSQAIAKRNAKATEEAEVKTTEENTAE